MMDAGEKWHEPRGIAPSELVDVRLQAHFAAEWVSRVGRFVAEPQPDYSHFALIWDSGLRGFKTQAMQTANGEEFLVVLQLAPLEVTVWQAGRRKSNIPLNTVTHTELGDWLENELNQVGLNGEAIHGKIPYELEHPRLSYGGRYDCDNANLEKFKALEIWFERADVAIRNKIADWIASRSKVQHRLAFSNILCWPHHFDIATLITLDAGDDAEKVRSIGIGMSPGDDTYPAPYFYINPWPRDPAKKLPAPPDGALWHTDGFFSLLIHAEQIKDRQALDRFIKDGTAQAATHIGYR